MEHDVAVVALGERLRALRYDAPHLERRLGRPPERLTPAAVATAERRAGDDELGSAIRFWNLGLPLPVEVADQMLGEVALESLAASGLVERTPTDTRASVRITAALGRLHAHDFDRGSALPEDHVLGVGAATRTLSGITPRTPVQRALDLGTGCGVQALGLAPHATMVVATDISERAVWMARLSTALAGVDNVEVRIGDALAPVAGEDFDLIVCNPPFVVSPADELTFRDGKIRGDELSRRLVQGVAQRLRPAGVACILVNWIIRPGEAATAAPQAWVADLPADVLLLHHDSLDPVAYAERWALIPGAADLESHRDVVGRWVAELERLGAAEVAAGAIVVERTDRLLRTRVERMRKRPAEGGSQVRRMLDAIGRFAGPDDPHLPATVFRLVLGHRIEQRLHYGTKGYKAGAAALRLDRCAGVVASVPADLLEAVFLIDGQATVAAIAQELASVRNVPAMEVQAVLLPLLLELYELGFLQLRELEPRA